MSSGGMHIAIAGIGNYASALIQGIHYYSRNRCREGFLSPMHTEIGGYHPHDIRVVAAFDVDARKVGQDLSRAIFAKPNCTTVFATKIPISDVTVRMGPVLDGISKHMDTRHRAWRICTNSTSTFPIRPQRGHSANPLGVILDADPLAAGLTTRQPVGSQRGRSV
jgi:myo-inositol-1-phosphate synthase